jgi:hypothetical protein
LSDFDQCSVHVLSDKTRTDGIVPDELTEDIKQGEKDETLSTSLLECILENNACIDGQKSGCMPAYNSCALKALEDFRNRRLRLLEDETPAPASRSEDKSDPDEANKYLSGNFTHCVQSYTACTAKASIALERSDCLKQFHGCSLELLKAAHIDDKQVEGFDLGHVGSAAEDTKLSSSLFTCIQEYFMCLMRKGDACLKTYNGCTLKVLDEDAKSKSKAPETEAGDPAQGPAREGAVELEAEVSSPATAEGSSTTALPETGSEGSADVLISAVTTESTNLGKG